MSNYSKQKRAQMDYCNICGAKTILTWDHVPPKACLNSIPVRINQMMDGMPKYNDYSKSSQNGVKFRSICSTCNNTLLGREYDPELVEFTAGLVSHIQSELEQFLPGFIDVNSLPPYTKKCKINRIARAVCGHILSAKNEFDGQTTIDCRLREYFLDPRLSPPKDYKLLFWFYPYSTITIARDFISKKVFDPLVTIPDGVTSIVSSFPLAYLLCSGSYEGMLDDLFAVCDEEIDREIILTVDFKTCLMESGELRHPLWPIYVSEDQTGVDMVLTSKHTLGSSVLGIRKLEIN